VQTVTTSKADGKVTVYPDQPLSVHTEKSAAPIDNSVLVRQIYAKNGANADGALLVIAVDGSSSPVTGWVGQYVPSPWAPADLSNVYSAVTHTPLAVLGGEPMRVEGYGGKLGYALLQETVPTPTQDVFIPLNPALVLNNAPSAHIGAPSLGGVGEQISFSSDGSQDADLDALTFQWDFGDGGVSAEANPSHPYAAPGLYLVTLAVSDGTATDSATATVQVIMVLKGDVNFDNQIGLADAVMGLQILSGCPGGSCTPTGVDMSVRVFHCDVDGDLKIGLAEILYILQKLAQLR